MEVLVAMQQDVQTGQQAEITVQKWLSKITKKDFMSKKISLKPNIACRTYKFEEVDSRSYIKDEQLYYQYLLENYASDIWYVIFTTQNYDKTYEYAKKHNLENELDDFLIELESLNLISLSGFYDNKFDVSKKTSFSSSVHVENTDTETDNCFVNENIFDEEKTSWLFKNNFLEMITLQLSYKCNLFCKHCYNDKDRMDEEISLEAAKRIIDEAYAIGISDAALSGGECTYNGNFPEIIKYIRQKYLSLSLLTNGQALYDDKDLFDSLVSLYPNKIKISLYSMNPEVHDNITRVKGSHKKALSVIKQLREKNIMVEINHPIFELNSGSLHEVLKFAADIRARVNCSANFIVNSANDNGSLRLKGDKLVNLYLNKDYLTSVYNEDFARREFKKEKRTICRASEINLSVSPNLNVIPCNDFKYILGNMNSDLLFDIWNNSAPKFRKKFLKSNLSECFKEDYCSHCMYCGVHSVYENGFMKKSFTACEHAKAYQEASRIFALRNAGTK